MTNDTEVKSPLLVDEEPRGGIEPTGDTASIDADDLLGATGQTPLIVDDPPDYRFTATADDVFLEADELEFRDQKLNTSARRYIFVTSLVSAQPGLEESVSFAGVVVFACLANTREIIRWGNDHDAFQVAFGEWVDGINLVPANAETFGEVAELAQKIVEGWVGGGNEVDEVQTGEGSPTSASGLG